MNGFLAGKDRINTAGVSGSSQRRVSASVTALAPSSRCLWISFPTSFSFNAALALATSRFNRSSWVARIGSCLAKMGSSEVLRAMLLSVMCGTVLHLKVLFSP